MAARAASTSARRSVTPAQAPGTENPVGIPPEEDPQRDLKEFSTYVFNDAQQTWTQIFDQEGADYEPAQLYLYANAVRPTAAARRPRRSGRSTARPTSASIWI